MLIQQAALTEFATRIFQACGAQQDVAHEVADHLVHANLKGHDSHGVGMIPTYVHNAKAGLLDVTAHAEVIRDSGAVILVDGRTGYGQVVGREATDLALERVEQTGVVCMGVRNCHHLGRIGTYGEQCGNAGFVSVHFVNVVGHEPAVSPYAGRERRMTTNPFCAVVPRRNDRPVVLDMATSAIALGKVRVAYNKGVDVPPGALVDHEGQPTTNPAVMYERPLGALGPFGGHKGYGLAVMCELLGGALAGEWTAQPGNERKNTVVNHMFQIVFDPTAFGGLQRFQDEVDAMVEYLHSTTPATGHDKVRVPGDPEQETMTARAQGGIEIDDSSWQGICAAAQAAGVEADAIP